MSAPAPSTNATAPPTPPAASPPTTSSSPPPPPSNSTSPSPPLSSSPPPPVPTSSPPAAVPTSPPPSTNSSASPPPPASSGATPPPPDSPPPPPSTAGSTPSPPPPASKNSSPPPPSSSSNGSPSPPPPSTTSSSSTTSSNAVIIGVVAVAGLLAAVLVIWCFTRLCRRKKKRRDDDDWAYYGQQPPPPPPPPHKGGYGDGRYGAHPQTWQNNAPPPANHVVGFSHPPSPPPPIASRPPQPPPAPQIGNSSGFSGASYSGSESILPPPSPGFALGFSKSMFTYEELSIATNGFSPANLLGQGGFGYVHKGILPDGKEVAIKQLKAGSGQGDREFQAEVEIISRVHHRYLVSLVGYCMTGSQRLLVYEFVSNNTLEFHLHGKGRPTMDWPTRLRVALGSAKGLAYLHEDCHPRIIHRDIKAANILLDFNFDAKVADFGLAKLSADNNTHVSTRVMGTFGYLAPEYASSGKLSEKSDVFSFGVMLLELITGRRPVDTTQSYMDDSLVDWARPLLTRAIEEGIYEELVDPKLENFNTKEMAQMVACASAAVRHSAKRRPKMSQIVRALENDLSLDDLNEGVRPGHSRVYGSSSDYDSSQYNEDMKKFRMIALASQEYGVSGQSVPTSEYGLNASTSSSSEGGGPQTREMELGAMRRDVRGTSPGGK